MYKKKTKIKPKSKTWIDQTTFGYEGKPSGDDEVKDHISIKSLKELPHSSYSLPADPYDAALPTSEPYPLLNKFNRAVGGHYDGEDNIDGGNVQQYANSTTSNFLKAFDEIRTKINVNYRYLPILCQVKVIPSENVVMDSEIDYDTLTQKIYKDYTTSGAVNVDELEIEWDDNNSYWAIDGVQVDPVDFGITVEPGSAGDTISILNIRSYAGIQLIEEQRKSIAESVSILQSTTFTQMAINNFAVVTDLPMGSAKVSDIDPNGAHTMAFTNLTDVLYAMSIYYQLVLQDTLGVMNWHNSFRLKQGTMIRNAWNREVPNLNSFFGLMNKKAFLSKLDSINLSFEGEYVDKDFMEQMNMLTLMPSRRSNSINDPVLELQCGFAHPTTFKVYVLDSNGEIAAQIFDDADMKLTVDIDGVAEDITIWSACDKLRDLLSMESTQRWARLTYKPGDIANTDNARYNNINALFNVIVSCFTYFKPNWSDFREAFDVMTRTGTISWTKGFRPSVVKDTDVALFWNLLVDHVYQLIFAGNDTLDYDENTKRWRTYSLWNMYSGIPSYDIKNGGAFLTLSFKNLPSTATTFEQYEYLPLLFGEWSDNEDNVLCVALSRDGYEAVVKQSDAIIQNNKVLRRLAPLASQSALKIRVPSIDYDYNTDLTIGHFSNLYKTLTQVFGLCRIQTEMAGEYDVALDPDILSVYQIEISDITNAAIAYARSNAPFRGTTSKEGILGFLSISRK